MLLSFPFFSLTLMKNKEAKRERTIQLKGFTNNDSTSSETLHIKKADAKRE